MDDPPCTQLLLIFGWLWMIAVISNIYCSWKSFPSSLGGQSLKSIPRHPGPPAEVRYLDPPKPKTPNLRRYDWMSRASILPQDLPGKFRLHFEKVLESTTRLFQDFPLPLKLLLWPSWRSRLPIHGMDLRSLSGWFFQSIRKI